MFFILLGQKKISKLVCDGYLCRKSNYWEQEVDSSMWEDGDGLMSFQIIFACSFDLTRSVISDGVTEMLQQCLVSIIHAVRVAK